MISATTTIPDLRANFPVMAYGPFDYDELPLGTFLVGCTKVIQPSPGIRIEYLMRIVKPSVPERYPTDRLTPKLRLLYYFLARRIHLDGSETFEAFKKLGQVDRTTPRLCFPVVPGGSAFELLDTFKIQCDARRGRTVSPALLTRAIQQLSA